MLTDQKKRLIEFERVVDRIGWGKYHQLNIITFCFVFMSDAVELGIFAILTPIFKDL